MRPAARPDPPPPDRAYRVTREGQWWAGVAALLTAIGWVKSIPTLLLLGYAMLALFGLSAWLARRQLRGLTVVRAAHAPVYAGESVRLSLHLHNAGPRAATAGVTGAGVTGLFEGVPPGGECIRSGVQVYPVRGVYGRSPPRVWSEYPFGLVRVEKPSSDGGEVVVLPAVGEVELEGFRRWVTRQVGADGRSRRRVARAAAERADLRGVRPYRPGDGLRDIHWKTTARRGEPFVREYDADPDPELVVVVEPWLSAEPTAAEVVNLEGALELAASLVRAWCLAGGTRVTVAVAGDEPTVQSASPSAVTARFLLAPLAAVTGTTRPALPQMRGVSRAARVVVSSRPGTPLVAALGQATGHPFAAVAPADRPPWYRPPHPAAQ